MRSNEFQPHAAGRNGVAAAETKDDLVEFGLVEAEEPLDLGFEQGNIVAYDDDFSFHTTVLSVGWQNTESD